MEGVIAKLEALVVKLEQSGAHGANVGKDIRNQLGEIRQGNVSGLSSIVQSLERQLGGGGEVDSDSLSESLSVYDQIISGPLAEFVNTSNTIGGDVAQHAAYISAVFQAQRQFLATAAASKKPSDADVMKLLKPTSDLIDQIQKFRESNRRSEMFNHLSAISESIPALGWVAVAPTPAPHVKEMKDAGMFYTNRVLKDWKEKDANHGVWVKQWVETLTQLQNFVKEYHTTGLAWNPKGGEASLNVSTPTVAVKTTTSVAKPAPAKTAKVFGKQVEKTPTKKQDGKKWIVEYFKGDTNLAIDDVQLNQTVYIYKCENSAVKITGKCNNVVLDSCKKTGVVFDSLVSGCEIVNCSSVQVQVLGSLPMIMVDKTDGCQMYLSEGSANAEIVSAKSSEMNVLISKDGEFVEMPVPEQFKTVVQGTNLVTSPAEAV